MAHELQSAQARAASIRELNAAELFVFHILSERSGHWGGWWEERDQEEVGVMTHVFLDDLDNAIEALKRHDPIRLKETDPFGGSRMNYTVWPHVDEAV